MNIFELMSEKYVLPDKPKLFESFAGIGCQRMAFDRLGIDYESVGISEIDKYAIKSYMAIHGDTKNYGDITKVKGKELPEIDVFTYSFPCTDLSKAGKQKGLNATRSGLVYEVLRILHEMDHKPQVLIMENVVDLVQTKFIREFQEIQVELESMGYVNYTEVLNGKDYGVAQNRERVFMVSILGDYYYEFPKPIMLEKRLKDYLEESVDEKYYLTDVQIKSMENPIFECMGIDRVNEVDGVCNTITTMGGGNREPKVIEPSGLYLNDSEAFHRDDLVGLSRCLKANTHDAGVNNGLRIRKLTPLECWRLMGIDDRCFRLAEQVVSNSQLYKCAGNGIIVDVFAAIIKQLTND